ncbi:MAG: PspC domain-containing protein [Fusobacteriaceae bacterium]
MEKKLYKSSSDKMLSGVCGGIGEYFGIDPTIVRILFAISFFGVIGIVIYIICCIVIPVRGANEAEIISNANQKKLRLSSTDKKIGGVCGGIAATYGWDSTLIRLIFVIALIFFGTGLLFYILCWLLIPRE